MALKYKGDNSYCSQFAFLEIPHHSQVCISGKEDVIIHLKSACFTESSYQIKLRDVRWVETCLLYTSDAADDVSTV